MNRRLFLRAAGAVPGTLYAAQSSPSAASESTPRKPEPRRLFLFMDWFHVKKGELAVILDPARISDAGRQIRDSMARDFGRTFEDGPHGNRPIEMPVGVRIVPEIGERSGRWLADDQPWEKMVGYGTVIREQNRYRCWYVAQLRGASQQMVASEGRGMEVSGSALAYAESEDGVSWKKPSLGVLSFDGSTQNNLVSPYNNGGCVFRDDHGLAAERYKCFHFQDLPKEEIPAGATSHQRYGLFGSYSADGYRWQLNPKPLVRHFSDTQNIAAWDPLLGKYVGYFRDIVGGRAITRAETDNYWDWPKPTAVLCAGPMDSPLDDLYFNGYTSYPDDPSLRLMFVSVYHHGSDGVDVRLALSREGRSYQWLSMNPIVGLGANGAWDGGSVYACPNLVHLPDGRLALPFQGYSSVHNEAWYTTFYKDFKVTSGLGWATWPDARIAGIEAGALGEFTVAAATFTGSRIEINARTQKAGSVAAELREKGKPIDGFAFAQSVPFNGDELWAPCRWKEKDDLRALNGKNIEVAFRMSSAKIFACRFSG